MNILWLDTRWKPARLVYVLAWHETRATVIEVERSGRPKVGATPSLVRSDYLRLTDPPTGVAA